MSIIDTHAHYDSEAYDDDRAELLQALPDMGVKAVITQGVNLPACRKLIPLIDKYDYLYATMGIHPEDVDTVDETTDWLGELESLLSHNKAVAVGEIGLDYHYDGFDREKQIRIFTEQVKLAKKLDLPCVIHSRDATEDCIEILRKYHPKGVMHCFSGSAETAKIILDLGLHISFTGVLTFKNAKRAIKACETVPLDKLMFETDAPYMAPEPYRGKRCDSSMTIKVAEKAAEIKGISCDDIVKITNENAIKLFGLQVNA